MIAFTRAGSLGAGAIAIITRTLRRAASPFGAICLAAGVAYGASGDDLTTISSDNAAFTQPFPFLRDQALAKFRDGEAIFRQRWQVGSSEDESRFVGLGPLWNHISCAGCHAGNGRGEPSASETDPDEATCHTRPRFGSHVAKTNTASPLAAASRMYLPWTKTCLRPAATIDGSLLLERGVDDRLDGGVWHSAADRKGLSLGADNDGEGSARAA